jgi:hypothetical protein
MPIAGGRGVVNRLRTRVMRVRSRFILMEISLTGSKAYAEHAQPGLFLLGSGLTSFGRGGGSPARWETVSWSPQGGVGPGHHMSTPVMTSGQLCSVFPVLVLAGVPMMVALTSVPV